jgi:hypothetical protein
MSVYIYSRKNSDGNLFEASVSTTGGINEARRLFRLRYGQLLKNGKRRFLPHAKVRLLLR